jgi:hypothetical protein
MRTILALSAITWLAATPASFAANANNPYGNIDHRNDAGNNTGDAQVEALNQAQLNSGGMVHYRTAPGYPYNARSPQYAQPGYPYPPPGAYPPPPPAYPPAGSPY